VEFYEGQYAAAVEHFKRANADFKPGSFPMLAQDALDQTQGDLVQTSAHFSLSVPRGRDEVLAPYALETLEKAFAALSTDLDVTPPTPIRVEVLPDDEALAKLSTLTPEQIRTTGTIAICKFNRLMIISPRALIHGYAWRDTLNHELAHLFISIKSGNTVPIWLHEGLAKFEETRWRGAGGQAMTAASEALLGDALRKDRLVTFEQMHPSMALLPSQEMAALAFAEVFHAIEFLKQKGGYPLLNQIITYLRDGDGDQEAVAKAFGAPFPRFVAAWKQYLRSGHYPPLTSSLAEPHLAFRPATQGSRGDAIDQTELGDFSDIAETGARNHAHLGEVLRQRRRPTAAIEEFKKARATVGDSSFALDSHYARALLDDGRPKEAISVLEASDKLYPGVEATALHLGLARLASGDPAGALVSLSSGLDTDPFDPALHHGLVEAARALHRSDVEKEEEHALALLEPPASATQALESPAADAGEPMATLMVATHPFAEITVDGAPVRRTTPTLLQLQPGHHRLELTNGERQLRRVLDVDLKAGENPDLQLDLDVPAAAAPADGGEPL
jgi:tetratricopeptide (TPR) repeat protein